MAINRLTGKPGGLASQAASSLGGQGSRVPRTRSWGVPRPTLGSGSVAPRLTPEQQAQRGAAVQAYTQARPNQLEALLGAAVADRGMALEMATHPYNQALLQADAAGDRAAIAEQSQRAGVDADYYNKLLGFAPRAHNLAEQMVGLGREEAGATRATATRNLNSEFTARGAWGSEFQRAGLGDIEGEFGRTGRGLDVKSGQNQLGLEQDIATAQHGLFGAQASGRGAGARLSAIDQKLAAGLNKLGLGHIADMDTLKMQADMGNAKAQAVIATAMAQVEPIPGGAPPKPPRKKSKSPGVGESIWSSVRSSLLGG